MCAAAMWWNQAVFYEIYIRSFQDSQLFCGFSGGGLYLVGVRALEGRLRFTRIIDGAPRGYGIPRLVSPGRIELPA